jgi:hypothetical protein
MTSEIHRTQRDDSSGLHNPRFPGSSENHPTTPKINATPPPMSTAKSIFKTTGLLKTPFRKIEPVTAETKIDTKNKTYAILRHTEAAHLGLV